MEKILVFGHKSPDTDSIASSVAMAYLQSKLGKAVEPRRLGNINKETEYALNHFKIGAPELLSSVDENNTVILVDHNEAVQSADGIEKAHIHMVVDHHTMDFKASEPLYYYAEPVGCTCTVLCKLFEQNNVTIPADVAGLMLSAIISDTLLFKSPTCTEFDRIAAEKLAKISNTDINTYGLAMLKAGTDLSSFSEKELVNLDAKMTTLGDSVKAKIAQVNTADIDDVMTRKDKIEAEMSKDVNELSLDLNILLLIFTIPHNCKIAI